MHPVRCALCFFTLIYYVLTALRWIKPSKNIIALEYRSLSFPRVWVPHQTISGLPSPHSEQLASCRSDDHSVFELCGPGPIHSHSCPPWEMHTEVRRGTMRICRRLKGEVNAQRRHSVDGHQNYEKHSPSGHNPSLALPMLIIGSMVNMCPTSILPLLLLPG